MPKKRAATKKPSTRRAKSASALTEARTTYLNQDDLYLFNEGNHFRLHEKLGSRLHRVGDRIEGTYFAVWAPNASSVHVVGDFNQWNNTAHPLHPRGRSGIWEGLVPEAKKGSIYKYHIVSQQNDYRVDKADPFAVHQETPPRTASIVWDLDYHWGDEHWMSTRRARNSLDAPVSIYEVHLGAWRRVPEDNNRSLSYREIAPLLVEYVQEMGFTHVELMPITEHPFYGSWGYQTTGYFAPTSRYGTPQDFMYLVDVLHQNDIGVILDWVPSHFPNDEHGLGFFDGTHLFEHADPRQGLHQEWDSCIFNYRRDEIRSFLISSALYWLAQYHVDGLRVDAVASMLYLDYARKEGEWVPNEFGGNENISAIDFLRRLNEEVYRSFPDVQTIAEESTAWPLVSRPTYVGGLGFGLKWDMGWMHDTLSYMSKEPVHRKFHQDQITFRAIYASNENFVLPLSHDEVVHGKGSLFGKMPGDPWQKFANLRLLFGYMFGQPGKKLLFMGGEFGQTGEWSHDESLEWHLLDEEPNAGLRLWLGDLNRFYRTEPSLHQLDCDASGFEWVDCSDGQHSIMSFLRRGTSSQPILAVYNFTPVPRHDYKVGVPSAGTWKEVLNSDSMDYGGSGQGNFGGLEADAAPQHGRPYSLNLTLPPLAALFLQPGQPLE